MKKLLCICALLVLTSGCGGGVEYGWQHPDYPESQLPIDEQNCEWDALHEKTDDLNFHTVERTDEEVEKFVKQCLESKGYKWGPTSE